MKLHFFNLFLWGNSYRMHRQKKTKFTRPRSCKLHLTCTVKRFFSSRNLYCIVLQFIFSLHLRILYHQIEHYNVDTVLIEIFLVEIVFVFVSICVCLYTMCLLVAEMVNKDEYNFIVY